MKIYVAGASAQIDLVEGFIAALKKHSHTITFDWTVVVRRAGSASPDDLDVRRAAAESDLRGVERSDLMWLVQPDEASTSTGAWVELGYAHALKDLRGRSVGVRAAAPPVLVVSGASKKCIFSDLADHRFASHDDALAFILEMAPRFGTQTSA